MYAIVFVRLRKAQAIETVIPAGYWINSFDSLRAVCAVGFLDQRALDQQETGEQPILASVVSFLFLWHALIDTLLRAVTTPAPSDLLFHTRSRHPTYISTVFNFLCSTRDIDVDVGKIR